MVGHISLNLLVPSLSSPFALDLFNSMWVVALHFDSSAIEMVASNRLQYASEGSYLPCLRQNMVLIAMAV